MKKFLIAILVLFGFATAANAQPGVNIGVSIAAGVFEAEGAKETFSGTHASDAASTEVNKKASDEGDEAEAAYAIGSIFAELQFSDRIAIGVDYVPHSLDTETTENKQNMSPVLTGDDAQNRVNTVQVDFVDYTTVYALVNVNENVFIKIGYSEVEAETNESLSTGGAYDNHTFDGMTAGIGYMRDLDNGAFMRMEVNYTEFDGVKLTNKNDSNKSVTLDGIEGYGAKVSLGKSF